MTPISESTKLLQDIVLRLDRLENELAHVRALIEKRLEIIEDCQDDHELRIRSINDNVTRVTTITGVSNTGSVFISIAAFIKALFP
jgi:hypothetical protein